MNFKKKDGTSMVYFIVYLKEHKIREFNIHQLTYDSIGFGSFLNDEKEESTSLVSTPPPQPKTEVNDKEESASPVSTPPPKTEVNDKEQSATPVSPPLPPPNTKVDDKEESATPLKDSSVPIFNKFGVKKFALPSYSAILPIINVTSDGDDDNDVLAKINLLQSEVEVSKQKGADLPAMEVSNQLAKTIKNRRKRKKFLEKQKARKKAKREAIEKEQGKHEKEDVPDVLIKKKKQDTYIRKKRLCNGRTRS